MGYQPCSQPISPADPEPTKMTHARPSNSRKLNINYCDLKENHKNHSPIIAGCKVMVLIKEHCNGRVELTSAPSWSTHWRHDNVEFVHKSCLTFVFLA